MSDLLLAFGLGFTPTCAFALIGWRGWRREHRYRMRADGIAREACLEALAAEDRATRYLGWAENRNRAAHAARREAEEARATIGNPGKALAACRKPRPADPLMQARREAEQVAA